MNILSAGIAIWILFGGAILCLLIDCIWPKKMTSLVYAVGILTLFASLFTGFKQWASFTTTLTQSLLVIDLLTLFFLFLVIAVGIITLFNALGYMKIHKTLTAEFCSLVLFSITGMVFLFASDHLFVNFIGLETMSLSIYVLVASHKKSYKSNEAAIKYFIIGGVASAILLYGIALFYGAFGTFKLSQLGTMLSTPSLAYLPKIAVSLILVGVFFKLAIVPFHFWAPDVYEGAPAPVTGFMATGVKIAAFGFALRLFISLNVLDLKQVYFLLNTLVIATFLVGNLLALVQDNVKRMLAYSSISHAGFLLFGIIAGYVKGTYMPFSSHVVLFYLLGYLLMTLGAFAVLSLLIREKSEADQLTDMRGLAKKHPVLAGVFTLFMISLIGIPGTVGFAAKFNIISMAVHNGHILLSVVAVLMSVVSAYYYLRPSVYMFFAKDENAPTPVNEIPLTACISMTICAFLVIFLGVAPDAFVKLAKIAATPLF